MRRRAHLNQAKPEWIIVQTMLNQGWNKHQRESRRARTEAARQLEVCAFADDLLPEAQLDGRHSLWAAQWQSSSAHLSILRVRGPRSGVTVCLTAAVASVRVLRAACICVASCVCV